MTDTSQPQLHAELSQEEAARLVARSSKTLGEVSAEDWKRFNEITNREIDNYIGNAFAGLPESPDTDLCVCTRVGNQLARALVAAQRHTPETPVQHPGDCHHRWLVRSMRDPQPDHTCANGCGFTWKQRCAEELGEPVGNALKTDDQQNSDVGSG